MRARVEKVDVLGWNKSYENDESSIGDRLFPKHVTKEALEAFGATLNFIDIRLKRFEDNYDAIRVACITAMKEMFKQIPLTTIRALTPKQKFQKLITYIGAGWYMQKGC